MVKHSHYPNNSKEHGYAVPWANGERSVCHHCGKVIRFVAGYEMRREYWQRVGR